jgi:HTH-type transcriptional regulator/antitoxin HipB
VPDDYPIHFTDQLRQHLRALRKKRGLTQAQVGALIGVSQARIAEIEANPGLVSFEQLLQLLSVLNVTLSLQEHSSGLRDRGPAQDAGSDGEANSFVPEAETGKVRESRTIYPSRPLPDKELSTSRRNFVVRTKKGSW